MSKADELTFNPYFTFPGNCEEAMNFYKEALHGELDIMRFEGSPVDVPDNYKQKVLHAVLRFKNAFLMASDSNPGDEINLGNACFNSLATTDLEEAQSFFNNLSEGGKIIMPFEETFWGAKFGMFTDKFGVGWMISWDKPEETQSQ